VLLKKAPSPKVGNRKNRHPPACLTVSASCPSPHLEGDPNCRAEIKNIGGRKRIIISALYDIEFGEELSYDYKLPLEDVKIPCNCGAANCRKFLN